MSESNNFEKSFVLQESYYAVAKQFPARDFQKFLEFLINYGLYGIGPDFSALSKSSQLAANASFIQIRQRIDSSKRRYDAAVANGKRGGRPRKNATSPKNPQKKPDAKPDEKPEFYQTQNQSEYQSEYQTQNLNVNDNPLGNYHYLNGPSSTAGGVDSPPPSSTDGDGERKLMTLEELEEKLGVYKPLGKEEEDRRRAEMAAKLRGK